MNRVSLVIGHEPDFAPLTFMDGDKSAGLIIDILAAAFKKAGVPIRFAPVPLPDHEAALNAGQIDAISFKAISKARAGDFDFSSALITSGAAWFALAERALKGSAPAKNSRLATPKKGPLLALLQNQFPDAEFPAIETYAQALESVRRGDADYAALNFHVGRYLADRDHGGLFELPEAPFLATPLGLACAKNVHGPTLQKFNEALAIMLADGLVQNFEKRWLEGNRL